MKLFLSYLKSHLRLLLMLALFGAVSAAVLLLYKAPLEGALYALLLCLALGLGFLAAGFLRYRRKHRALQRALVQLPEGLPPLPEPQAAPEADYQALLTALDEDRRQIAARAAQDRDRAETFYTAWVHQIKTPLAAMDLLLQSGQPDGALLKGELFRMEKYADLVVDERRLPIRAVVKKIILMTGKELPETLKAAETGPAAAEKKEKSKRIKKNGKRNMAAGKPAVPGPGSHGKLRGQRRSQ